MNIAEKDVVDSTANETCPACNGSGEEAVFHNMGADYRDHYSSKSTCSICKGDGVTDAETAAKIRKRHAFFDQLLTLGTVQQEITMGRKTFEEAKAELLECAVGGNEYGEITTWEEIADAAAFESSMAADKASRLQSLLNQATEEAEGED